MASQEEVRRVTRALTTIARTGAGVRRHRLRATAAGVDVTLPGILILGYCCNNGPSRLTELARDLEIPAPVVSREAKRLVETGALRRASTRDDGRVTLFVPTAAGRRTNDRYRSVSDQEMSRLLDDWTEDEVVGLAEQLERIVDAFRTYGDALYSKRPPR